MSRLGIHALLVLAGASLVVSCSITAAAAAMDTCGKRYRSCNVGCNQSVPAGSTLGVCKRHCDLQLIACDTEPAAPLMQAREVPIRRLPSNEE
jgi:hypothetical protein